MLEYSMPLVEMPVGTGKTGVFLLFSSIFTYNTWQCAESAEKLQHATTHFIVIAHSTNGQSHPTDIPCCDWILEEEERDGDDDYPFCGVSHGIANRRYC